MSEGFLWVLVLHGIGFFMLGWGVLRIWISITIRMPTSLIACATQMHA